MFIANATNITLKFYLYTHNKIFLVKIGMIIQGCIYVSIRISTDNSHLTVDLYLYTHSTYAMYSAKKNASRKLQTIVILPELWARKKTLLKISNIIIIKKRQCLTILRNRSSRNILYILNFK